MIKINSKEDLKKVQKLPDIMPEQKIKTIASELISFYNKQHKYKIEIAEALYEITLRQVDLYHPPKKYLKQLISTWIIATWERESLDYIKWAGCIIGLLKLDNCYFLIDESLAKSKDTDEEIRTELLGIKYDFGI